MQTGGEISRSSSSGNASTSTRGSSLDSSGIVRQEANNVGALSSLQSDGTPKMRTIAIGVQAHRRLQNEPFAYAFNHLVEQKNCKVVVICCLSRIQDEMGVDHPIDVEAFGGISNKKLESAINTQINNLNHFLRVFREQLIKRGVQLDIRISAGPRSHDILIQAAKALQPHWVVLDRSFAGLHKKIQIALECNLVLMKRGTDIDVLQLTTKYLGPVEQINDPISEEDPEVFSTPRPSPRPSLDSRSSSSNAGPNGAMRTPTQAISLKYQNTIQETTNSRKVFSCISCICFPGRSAGHNKVHGPTGDQTVLYGDTAPGCQPAYLGKVGHRPSVKEEFALLSSRSVSSPAASPSSWFSLGNRSSSNTTTKRSVKSIEAELEAQMALPPDEDTEPYRVQL